MNPARSAGKPLVEIKAWLLEVLRVKLLSEYKNPFINF